MWYTAKAKKETRIKREADRLREIFSTLDQNKLSAVQTLIDRAAYLTVSLEDLEQEIDASGWTEEYCNGKEQTGIKQSAAASLHVSLTKNLTAIMKQLIELVPPAQRGNTLLGMMRK